MKQQTSRRIGGSGSAAFRQTANRSRPAGDGRPTRQSPPSDRRLQGQGGQPSRTIENQGRVRPQAHAARTGTRKLAVAAGEGARRSRAVSAGEREKLGDIPTNSGMVATVCPVSTLGGSVAILRLDAWMNDVQQVGYHNEGGVTSDGNQTQGVLQFSF